MTQGRILAFLILFSLVLSGCEWFSTASVAPRPESLNQYQDIIKDSLVYKMEEVQQKQGSWLSDSILTRKKVIFDYVKDSIAGGQELAYIRMSIQSWKEEEQEAESFFLVKVEEDSIQYAPAEGTTGPKLFLLKVSADSSEPENYFHLLSLLAPASRWIDNSGPLEFSRKIPKPVVLDTLEYNRRLEETWVIEEEVTYGSQTLMQGKYWYGNSGLLQCTQTWPGLDFRKGFGESQGKRQVVRKFFLL
jgi:hypothetical protein